MFPNMPSALEHPLLIKDTMKESLPIQSLCQQPLSFALRSLWPQGPSSKCSLYLKQYLFTWKKPIEPNSFFHSLHCLSCLPFFSSKCLRFLKIIFNFISPIPKPMSFKCSKNIYRSNTHICKYTFSLPSQVNSRKCVFFLYSIQRDLWVKNSSNLAWQVSELC